MTHENEALLLARHVWSMNLKYELNETAILRNLAFDLCCFCANVPRILESGTTVIKAEAICSRNEIG